MKIKGKEAIRHRYVGESFGVDSLTNGEIVERLARELTIEERKENEDIL